MRDTDQYRIDEPRVIGEVMEGEFILVHFESGRYYSVRGVGADICQLLSSGCTFAETIRRIAEHFRLPESQLAPEIRQFVDGLVNERVLVPAGVTTQSDRPVVLAATTYESPRFEKFDDMADQLLLDPIHEIDETGWPTRKTA
ncbi:MAG: PqqD family protein [Planctomycetes bacterium]|nr:PqqD family protein [Planctomycetota bacterium]